MGIIDSIAIGILIVAVLVLVLLLALEIQYRRRPGNKLELTSGNWQLEVYEPQHYRLVGELEFRNLTRRLEVMVPEVRVDVRLLSSGSLEGITTTAQVIPRYKDASPRADGYWEGHIVKREVSPIEVVVEIAGENLSQLSTAWVQIHFLDRKRHV